MNFSLYKRPYSSENLHKNLNPLSSQRLYPKPNPENWLIVSSSEFPLKQFLKSEIEPEGYHKSPDDSQYNIKIIFPDRPKTSHLSGLTLKENERSTSQVTLLTKPRNYESLSLSQPSLSLKLPSEQDFTKILTKLEMVSSNRTGGHRRIVLNDSDSIDILLEFGTTQYFCINSKGLKSPMVVILKRKKGKVVTYTSKVNPEPSRGMCDSVFKTDFIQVSDISGLFKVDAVYLGIEAITETILSMSVHFGKKNLIKKISGLRNQLEDLDSANKLTELVLTTRPDPEFSIKNHKSTKPVNKDFIKLNLENAKQKILPLTTTAKIWKTRKEQAQTRKKVQMLEKKEKTTYQINKHLIKRQMEREKRLKNEELMINQTKEKMWISFIFLINCTSDINKLRNYNRQVKLIRIRKGLLASKIQRAYRLRAGTDLKHVTFLRTSHLLKLFCVNTKPFLKNTLTKCIKESSKNHLVPYAFTKTIDKLILVQRTWQAYCQKNKIRTENFIKLWNNVVEEQILKAAMKKHPKESKKYSSISLSVRTTILNEHIIECKKKYLKLISEYKGKAERKVENVINQFRRIKKLGTLIFSADAPIYTILPSKAEMLKLIEKAIKISN